MAGFQFFRLIGADGPWRHVDAEFQSQLRCDPALPPSRVLANHLRDECAKVRLLNFNGRLTSFRLHCGPIQTAIIWFGVASVLRRGF